MRFALLIVVAVLSVGLMSLVDQNAFAFLRLRAPGTEWIADLRLTSLSVIGGLAFATVDRSAFGAPRTAPPRGLVVACVLWLMGNAIAIHALGVWTYKPARVVDYAAFLLTGLACEDLLFRGVVFDLAKRALGGEHAARVPRWVLVSAVAFGLSHLQYHHFRLDAASMSQVAYTIPMGIILALLRERTASLWPPVLFHLLNNGVTLAK